MICWGLTPRPLSSPLIMASAMFPPPIKAKRTCSSMGRSFISAMRRSWWTRAKDGCANAHQRGAFFDGHLKIRRHAHGQLLPLEPLNLLLDQTLTQLTHLAIKRPGSFGMHRRWRDGHQSPHLEMFELGQFMSVCQERLRVKTALRQLPPNVHFEQHGHAASQALAT